MFPLLLLALLHLPPSPSFTAPQQVEAPPILSVSTSSVATEIRLVQKEHGLSEAFYKTAVCESHLDTYAVGDQGTSFGVWQIHLPAHPDITKAEATDYVWATEWAAHQFLEGHAKEWTCYRILTGSQGP